MKTTRITPKQFDSYAIRIQNKTAKEHGISKGFTWLQRAVDIEEIEADTGILVVSENWKEQIKEAAAEIPE